MASKNEISTIRPSVATFIIFGLIWSIPCILAFEVTQSGQWGTGIFVLFLGMVIILLTILFLGIKKPIDFKAPKKKE